jgi:glycosyltransferase involved in cell wall biosynthesis
LRILAIYPYSILPPLGGGALRCANLLRELSSQHEVHAIIHQGRREWDQNRRNFGISDNVCFYSSVDDPTSRTVFDRLPRRIGPSLHYRWLRKSWRGPAEATLLRNHHLIEKALRENTFDFVLFEHLSTAAAAPMVKRLSPKTVRILDAHNVDHLLLAQELQKSPDDRIRKAALKKVYWQEHNLSRFVDFFFACSDLDRDILSQASGVPGFTVPNGVDCDYFSFDYRPGKSERRKLIFSGWLGTQANQDALSFIADQVWPAIRETLPHLELDVVGGGIPDSLRGRLDAIGALNLVGEVPDMRPYYRQASILLVPLRIGSGTRLKILEAMSQGNPVVSTGKGAEGLSMEPGRHFLLAETPREFSEAVRSLLREPGKFEKMRIDARAQVEKLYDWKVIGVSANRFLDAHSHH